MEATRQAFADFRVGKASAGQLWATVCADIVRNVGSTRASVWTVNAEKDRIRCEALLDARSGEITSGIVLRQSDFPEYFAAIYESDKVIAPDAANHPATRCFEALYFAPNDIKSLLDFVVLDGRHRIGVLCCEHCGQLRQWSEADIRYLQTMAAVLGMTMKATRASPERAAIKAADRMADRAGDMAGKTAAGH